MSTQHKNLTGTNLHEPKGVASATSGQVYIADGAGSGSWGVVAGLPHAQIYIAGNTDIVDITNKGTYYAAVPVAGDGWQEYDAEGLTTSLATGRIVVPSSTYAGQYFLHATLTIGSSRVNNDFAFKFAKNGNVFGNIQGQQANVPAYADHLQVSGFQIIHGAVANDYFQVFVTFPGTGAEQDGDDVYIISANFAMYVISA